METEAAPSGRRSTRIVARLLLICMGTVIGCVAAEMIYRYTYGGWDQRGRLLGVADAGAHHNPLYETVGFPQHYDLLPHRSTGNMQTNALAMRDDEYTKEKLEALMKEVQLELTCIYARNYNLLLKVKGIATSSSERE